MTRLDALKAIAARDGGLLRPVAVVEAARPKSSPLHGAFEWNDGKAAQQYRLIQAQKLIRSFTVAIESGNGRVVDVPVFVGISSDRDGRKAENPYRLREELEKNSDLMAIAVADALDQLEAVRSRYEHLQELADVWSAIGNHKRRKA